MVNPIQSRQQQDYRTERIRQRTATRRTAETRTESRMQQEAAQSRQDRARFGVKLARNTDIVKISAEGRAAAGGVQKAVAEMNSAFSRTPARTAGAIAAYRQIQQSTAGQNLAESRAQQLPTTDVNAQSRAVVNSVA